ncbi:MAG TPA: hypothetical protein PKI11_18845 [Candidatus Hydrogenedentes bacterium]|nr:hypothetical protein [Candidatus Hydrogenedentota bacterium]HNT87542.1 hypothetical protein [Candidatus Hydrogenedentota bacterium]
MNEVPAATRPALSRSARRTLEAFIVTLVANDRDLLDRADMKGVLDRADAAVGHFPPVFRFALRAALFAFEYLPCLLARKIMPFRRLPLEKRIVYAETWAYHRISLPRTLFKLFRFLAVTSLMQDPELVVYTGYAPALEHRLTRPKDNDEVSCGQGVAP